MKVLMCNKFHWPLGGSETVYFDNIRMLEAHGHETAHFAMQDERNVPSEWSRYFVRNVDYTVDKESGLKSKLSRIVEAVNVLYSFEASRKIAALVDEFRPDLAHLHNIYHQISPSILTPLKKRGIPVVLTLHDYKLVCPGRGLGLHNEVCEKCVGGKFYHAVLRKCVKDSLLQSLLCTIEMYAHVHGGVYKRGVDLFIAPSEFLRRKMMEAGWPSERIVTLHNTPNLSQCEPRYEPGDYFLYVGRVDPEKGMTTLIRATELTKVARLVIVGDGSLRHELERYVAERNLTQISFRGRLEPHDVYQAMRHSLALVLPSELYENCPMSILESFAHGKPAIGTNIGGIPELIDHNVDGILFQSRNAEELANAMLTLWQNRSMAEEMGRRARGKVEREFTSERYYDELIRLYRKVLPSWKEPL